MTVTPGLGLTEHVSAGANGHINANEAYRILELFSSIELKQFQLIPTPGVPVEGELNVVGTGGTGAFSGHDGELALFLNGGWRFFLPKSGMQLMVNSAATHDFAGIMIAYSEAEALWFPVLPFAVVGTAYWTGKYFTGTTVKVYSRAYTGNIATGTGIQNFAHGLTLVWTNGAWVEGYIFDPVALVGGEMPGRIAAAQIALYLDNTNIIFNPTGSLGANYDYRFVVFHGI